MSTLVLLEHQNQRLRPASLAAISFAHQLGELDEREFDLLFIGSAIEPIVEASRGWGARALLAADHPALAEPLADRYAAILTQVARDRAARNVVAAASTFSKDILPRAAALLEAGMLSDVLSVEREAGSLRVRRPVFSGNAIATVTLAGEPRVLTCRATAFPPPAPRTTLSPVESVRVDPSALPDGMDFISGEQREAGRPELTEARVVVTGGRPLGDRETFERVIGALADALGGAVGATRAAVDSGIAPNDWQVGQTGKIVAPELYVACGVSGAIQHLAGMKDAKVIVAINRDPEAPIFQIATYGLVADLHEAVPALTQAIRDLERDGNA